MHDFLLFTRPAILPTRPSEEMQHFLAEAFRRSVREFQVIAERELQIRWQTDFDPRPDRSARIFRASDQTAKQVLEVASLVPGVRVEVVPLD